MDITGLPLGAVVDIYSGPQNLSGGPVTLPVGITIQWRVEVNGFNGPWNDKEIDCTALDVTGRTCEVGIENLPMGAVVDIYSGPQNLSGGPVTLPMGITIKWRVQVNNYDGPWIDKEIDCSAINVAPHVCAVDILNLPVGAVVDMYSGPQNLSGGPVTLPMGITIKWRVQVNNYDGPWIDKEIDCSAINVAPHVCAVDILNLPVGAVVDMYSGPQNLSGGPVTLPMGITIKWRVQVNNYDGPWIDKEIDCSAIDVAPHVCAVDILNLPVGAVVDMYSGPQNLSGGPVTLPMGITIKWRVQVNNYDGPWIDKEIDCSAIDVAPHVCAMDIVGLPAGGKVDLYSGPQNLTGGPVTLPTGINIQWRIELGGLNSQWQTKPVDCNPLAVEPKATIKLPPGVWVYVNGTGWFQNGAVIDVGLLQTYSYKLTDCDQEHQHRLEDQGLHRGRLWQGLEPVARVLRDGGAAAARCLGLYQRLGLVPERGQGLAAEGRDHQLPGDGQDQEHQHRLADQKGGLYPLAPDYCDMLVDLPAVRRLGLHQRLGLVPGRGQGLAAGGRDHQLPGDGQDQEHQHRLADPHRGLHPARAGLLRHAGGPADAGLGLHQRLGLVPGRRPRSGCRRV